MIGYGVGTAVMKQEAFERGYQLPPRTVFLLSEFIDKLDAEYEIDQGATALFWFLDYKLSEVINEKEITTSDSCTCSTCWPDYPYFRVCVVCGNKRCPKAKKHNNDCINSNEPGQKGNNYEI